MDKVYIVYQLLDYKGFVFYIGITKNLSIRIREHTMHKNATPAKKYRVRRCIDVHGKLKYKFTECKNREEALKLEADLIQKFQYQLVNKTHGKVKKESTQRRSKGRSKQCPHCLNYYKRIGAHKCKNLLGL